MSTFTEVTAVPRLAPRPADGHKGTFGTVLVVAGSRGMSGAAVLCGSAALRGGAGLVRVATAAEAADAVAAGNPCYTTLPLPHEPSLAAMAVLDAAGKADVVALGPGLGQGEAARHVVREAVPRIAAPLVIDADGLNLLACRDDCLRQRPAATVLTPHPGEFARLTGKTAAEVNADRDGLAAKYAADHKVVVVLKGARTVVTDGGRLYRNTTGNPGMGTGGTGDVLAGLVAALIGQGLAAFDAAVLGVYLHGLAGDLARDAVGEVSLCATDVLAHLPAAVVRHQRAG